MKNIVFVLSVVFLVGCGTSVKNPTKPEIEPDVVVSRIDNLSSRPDWIWKSFISRLYFYSRRPKS